MALPVVQYDGYTVQHVDHASPPPHEALVCDEKDVELWPGTPAKLQQDEQVQAPAATTWTRPAKSFMLSITLFVVSTVALLAYLIHVQRKAMDIRLYASLSQSDVRINLVLQGQTIMAEVILLLIAYHAIVTQNIISVLAVLGFNISLVISGILEAVQRRHTFHLLEKSTFWKSLVNVYGPKAAGTVTAVDGKITLVLCIIPAVDFAFHIGCDWAAWLMYKELGWIVYKRVSADLRMRTKYMHVLILRSLQLLQAIMALHVVYYVSVIHRFTSASGAIQPYRHQTSDQRSLTAYVYIILGLLAIVPAWVGVTWGVQREHRWAFALGACSQVAMTGLLSFAFFTNRVFSTTASEAASTDRNRSIANAWKAYFHFSLFLLFSVLSITWSVVVWAGFGNGLKDVHVRQVHSHTKIDLDAE